MGPCLPVNFHAGAAVSIIPIYSDVSRAPSFAALLYLSAQPAPQPSRRGRQMSFPAKPKLSLAKKVRKGQSHIVEVSYSKCGAPDAGTAAVW